MRVLQDFFEGILAPIRGYRLIRKHRSLFWRAALPLIFSLIIFGTLLVLLGTQLPNITNQAFQWVFKGTKVDDLRLYAEQFGFLWKYILLGLISISLILLKVLIFGVVVILCFLIVNILCSFLWELLVEKTLILLGRTQVELRGIALIKVMFLSAVRGLILAAVFVLGALVLWISAFVPIIGPFIGLVAVPAFTAGVFGFSLFDYSMEVENIRVRNRFRWAVRNMPILLGIGVIAYVPFLNFFLLPCLMVGATDTYIRRFPKPSKMED